VKQLKAQQSKDIHYMWKQTITVLIITVLACKCIQSFVERRLQDDQRPFIRVPGNTSHMQNTVSL